MGIPNWSCDARVFALVGALLLLSCAPATSPPAGSNPMQARGGAAPDATAPAATKVLRLGIPARGEPHGGLVLFDVRGTTFPQTNFLLHAGLTVFDAQPSLQPWIAATVPSTANGDWRMFPDGGMEVTWKLRPEVRWHDATPLTAEDFVFGLQVLQDRALPAARPASLNLIAGIEALDPSTLIVRWKQPYFLANVGTLATQPALPRHLLAELHQRGDPETFLTSGYFNTQFVGLGPYRLANWELGSQMELVAFDQYFQGRPKIDRMVIKFYGNPSAVVTALLAQDVDGVPNGVLAGRELATIRESWEASGAGAMVATIAGSRNYRYVFRDPTYPWARDVRVRHALIHMLDRQGIVDGLYFGMTTPADTIAPPSDPIQLLVQQRGMAGHPFDLTRAQALMTDAGWTKGSDGAYRDAGGQPFTIEIRGSDNADNVAEAQVVAAQWRSAGLNANAVVVPATAVNEDELRAVAPGVNGKPIAWSEQAYEIYITAQIAAPENRWVLSNTGAYRNPAYDTLYDRYLVTFETPARQQLAAEMEKLLYDDAASINLRFDYGTCIAAFRQGIRGPGVAGAIQPATTWNAVTWDMD